MAHLSRAARGMSEVPSPCVLHVCPASDRADWRSHLASRPSVFGRIAGNESAVGSHPTVRSLGTICTRQPVFVVPSTVWNARGVQVGQREGE